MVKGHRGHLPIFDGQVWPRAEICFSSFCLELELGHVGPVGGRVREAGFSSILIPFRWSFLGEHQHCSDKAWMDLLLRVVQKRPLPGWDNQSWNQN